MAALRSLDQPESGSAAAQFLPRSVGRARPGAPDLGHWLAHRESGGLSNGPGLATAQLRPGQVLLEGGAFAIAIELEIAQAIRITAEDGCHARSGSAKLAHRACHATDPGSSGRYRCGPRVESASGCTSAAPAALDFTGSAQRTPERVFQPALLRRRPDVRPGPRELPSAHALAQRDLRRWLSRRD